MTITYPPEMLPSPDEGDDAEIIVRPGFEEWNYRVVELRVIDGQLWGRLEEKAPTS